MARIGESPMRTRLGALDLERRAWDLFTTKGMLQRDIAVELHVTQSAVSRALKRAERKTIDELKGKVSAHKARQLARLEALYRIAMTAYHASIGDDPIRTRVEKSANGGTTKDGKPLPGRTFVETKVQVRKRVGDARHLEVARGVLADIRKLLGLDAPQKVSIVDADRPDEQTPDEALRQELADIMRQINQSQGLSGNGEVH